MEGKATGGVAILLLSLSLLGCSGSGGAHRNAAASAPERHGSPAWRPSPAASGETVFPGVGVRYRPTDEAAPVAAAEAVKLAGDTPLAHAVTGDPKAVLARATDDDFAPGTTPAHHDENVLAWVVTYHNTLPAFHRSRTAPSTCDAIVIVDARRARVLDMFQTCPGH